MSFRLRKVKFVKYQVTDDGGERVLETLVSVSVDGSTVDASNRLRKGETASIGEVVNTVTVTKTTKIPIKMLIMTLMTQRKLRPKSLKNQTKVKLKERIIRKKKRKKAIPHQKNNY